MTKTVKKELHLRSKEWSQQTTGL